MTREPDRDGAWVPGTLPPFLGISRTDTPTWALLVRGGCLALIQPIAVRTRLDVNTAWAGERADGSYHEFRRLLADWHARTYQGSPYNIADRYAISADAGAAVITHAATTRRPRACYPVGILARALFLLRRWLPQAAFDAFVRSQFPVPRTQEAPVTAVMGPR